MKRVPTSPLNISFSPIFQFTSGIKHSNLRDLILSAHARFKDYSAVSAKLFPSFVSRILYFQVRTTALTLSGCVECTKTYSFACPDSTWALSASPLSFWLSSVVASGRPSPPSLTSFHPFSALFSLRPSKSSDPSLCNGCEYRTLRIP